MTIEISTIEKARLVPELLPQASFHDITANQEVSPPLLDLRRFPGKLLRLSEIAVERDAQVELRIRADDIELKSPNNSAAGLFDLAPNNFQMLAKNRLYYNLFSTADEEDLRTSFGVWVQKLTVADKLKLGVPLTNDEKELDRELGVSKSVEKGVLPLPLEQQIEREYRSQLISEETHGRTLAVKTSSIVVETIYPRRNEIIVLTKLAATAGTADNNARISISRDEDADYITDLKTYAVGLDRELSMFIPALSELTLNIISNEAAGVSISVRYTIWRCRLSNLLRARWGLELPPERENTIKRVKAGIL